MSVQRIESEGRLIMIAAGLERDIRHRARSLLHARVFTTVIVLTLGFGIGANTVVLSLIRDLLGQGAGLDRGRLVSLHSAKKVGEKEYRPFSHAEFEAIRAQRTLFDDAAAMALAQVIIGDESAARESLVCCVSESYFTLLGAHPWRGRFFSAEESRPQARLPVVVLSYPMWQSLGASPALIGSQLRISGRAYEVIGVGQPDFGGLQWAIGPSAWVPLGMYGALVSRKGEEMPDLRQPWLRPFNVVASLVPGQTLESARLRLPVLDDQLNGQAAEGKAGERELIVARPSRTNLSLTQPTDEGFLGGYAAMAGALSIAVLFVASLNVANMLLARGTTRQKEIAIRLCIGASRTVIVRELLVESALLTAGGGVVAVALSYVTRLAFQTFAQRATGGNSFVMHFNGAFSPSVLWITGGLCALTALVAGLGPALAATKVDLVEQIKQQGGPRTARKLDRLLSSRSGLVIAQIALSVMLLFSAVLLARSAAQLGGKVGFDTEGVVARFNLEQITLRGDDLKDLQRRLLERTASVSGVEKAALAAAVPYNLETSYVRVFDAIDPDLAAGTDGGRFAIYNAVTEHYFSILGIAVLRGRAFTAAETQGAGARGAVIIDQRLAENLFGRADPLGREIVLNRPRPGEPPPEKLTVVGVVLSPREDPYMRGQPWRIYRPLGQAGAGLRVLYVHAQTRNAAAVAGALRRDLGGLHPDLPLLYCGKLGDLVGNNLNLWSLRLAAGMFAVFGLMAGFMAVIGLYAVKSFTVERRTRDFGIRVALGATTQDIVRLVVREACIQIVAGVTAGMLLAGAASAALTTLLEPGRAATFSTLALVVLLLAGATVLASLIPALRASRVSPAIALKAD